MIVAFIPARGGSKGIPKKNIKNLLGRPLIQWVIDECKKSKLIDKIVVSSDDDEILEVANKLEVEAFKRSPENATDFSRSEDAIIEYAKNLKPDDVIVFLQATSPLIKCENIEEGIILIKRRVYDSVLSVVRQRRFTWNGGIPNYDINKRPRRQEYDGILIENGAFYISRAYDIIQTECRLSGSIGTVECDEDTYFEIDEISDWEIVEKLAKRKFEIPKIKLFATDVDGTLTDGCCYIDENGKEIKKFNVRDGWGFNILRNHNIKSAFISGSKEICIEKRAEKVKADECFLGIDDKVKILKQLCEKYNITPKEIAYIGDDVNDIDVMKMVGISFCPQDAEEEVKQTASIIIDRNGGDGAFRKAVEIVIKGQL